MVHVDAGDLPEELEEVGDVHHGGDLAVRGLDERPGNEQRHPGTRLVGEALGPRGVERALHGRRERAVVAQDHEHRVGRFGVVVESPVRQSGGQPDLDEQSPKLGVEGLDHLVAERLLVG